MIFRVDLQAQYLAYRAEIDAAAARVLAGGRYTLGPEVLAVEFRHSLRFKSQSAGPPIAELLSKPLPYTELITQVRERFMELMQLVAKGKNRKLLRIGIISTTVVSEDEVPPGINRFLNYVGKPWDNSVEAFSIAITAKLPKSKNTARYDRCIHVVSRQEDSEGLVTIQLDWQRYFDEDKNLSMTSLPELLDAGKSDALAYFEDIAEGGRFDG